MGRVLFGKTQKNTVSAGLLTGFCNGLFGAGGGMVAVFALQHFCGCSPKQAHAGTIGLILPLSLVSAIVYMRKGTVDYESLLFVCPGLLLGSFLGAKLLGRLSTAFLQRLFSVLMAAAGLLLLWR